MTPQAMTNPTATAIEISKLAKETTKPIIANWMGGKSMSEGIKILNDNGIQTIQHPKMA